MSRTEMPLVLHFNKWGLGPWETKDVDEPARGLCARRRWHCGEDLAGAALIYRRGSRSEGDRPALVGAIALPVGERIQLGDQSVRWCRLGDPFEAACDEAALRSYGPDASFEWLVESLRLMADLRLVEHFFPKGSKWMHERTGGPYTVTGYRKMKQDDTWSVGIDYERAFPFGTLPFARTTVENFARSFRRA